MPYVKKKEEQIECQGKGSHLPQKHDHASTIMLQSRCVVNRLDSSDSVYSLGRIHIKCKIPEHAICIIKISTTERMELGMERQFASLIFGVSVFAAAGLINAFNSRNGYVPLSSLSSPMRSHKGIEYVENLAAIGLLKPAAIRGDTRSLTPFPQMVNMKME